MIFGFFHPRPEGGAGKESENMIDVAFPRVPSGRGRHTRRKSLTTRIRWRRPTLRVRPCHRLISLAPSGRSRASLRDAETPGPSSDPVPVLVTRGFHPPAVHLRRGGAGEDFRKLVEAEPGAFALLGDLAAGRAVLVGDARVLESRVPAGSWMKLFQAYALVVGGQVDAGRENPLRRLAGAGPALLVRPGAWSAGPGGGAGAQLQRVVFRDAAPVGQGGIRGVAGVSFLPEAPAGRADPSAWRTGTARTSAAN